MLRFLHAALRSKVLLVGVLALTLPGLSAWASSHSDAPLISQDPQANLTDVYAFVGRQSNLAKKTLNIIVHVRPYSEPGNGAVYERFASDALYSIHIANPATGETLIRYDFRFTNDHPVTPPRLKSGGTILSYGNGTALSPILNVGDAGYNFTQVNSVTRSENSIAVLVATGLSTPPPNLGKRTTPHYNDPTTGFAISGATAAFGLDLNTRQTVHLLSTGDAVFAGSREDGFYGDVPGLFDLFDGRIFNNDGDPGDGLGQDGNGVDGFKGFNVLAYAVRIPLANLPRLGYTAPFADLANPLPATGASRGVYASVSRRQTTMLSASGAPVNSGPWMQVNRMGNPLFNEALVALSGKDRYNRTSPPDDAAMFAGFALAPELATLLNTVFGTSFAATGRSDLESIFIPEVLRVDTTTPPATLSGQAGFNRLGFIGGDTAAGSLGRIKSGGWPDGRRLGDDVVDTSCSPSSPADPHTARPARWATTSRPMTKSFTASSPIPQPRTPEG